jgi:hypothetical protein
MLTSKSVGRERLHPGDKPEARGYAVFALSNGAVDLSKVPSHRETRRRVERENASQLKARLKRESRHRNR